MSLAILSVVVLVRAQGGGSSREVVPPPADPVDQAVIEQSVQQVSVSDIPLERVSETDYDRFLAFGDWGDHRAVSQIDRINQFINNQLRSLNGVLLLGDNFYPTGINPVLGLSDPILDLFTHHLAANLPSHFPFYTVLGNNDIIQKGGTLQVDFSTINSNWVMNSEDVYLVRTRNEVCIWAINSNKASKASASALDARIQADMNEAPCRWRVLTCHLPMITAGAYRTSPGVTVFRRNFFPLVVKHRFDFFIAGHDHTAQVLEVENSSCVFLISGASVEVRTDSIDRSAIIPGGGSIVWGDDSRPSILLSLQFSRENVEYKFVHLDETGHIIDLFSGHKNATQSLGRPEETRTASFSS